MTRETKNRNKFAAQIKTDEESSRASRVREGGNKKRSGKKKQAAERRRGANCVRRVGEERR